MCRVRPTDVEEKRAHCVLRLGTDDASLVLGGCRALGAAESGRAAAAANACCTESHAIGRGPALSRLECFGVRTKVLASPRRLCNGEADRVGNTAGIKT